jgi:D-alanyl-D-alanine carboxypeptidase (penicillin-binding protein 5/6)
VSARAIGPDRLEALTLSAVRGRRVLGTAAVLAVALAGLPPAVASPSLPPAAPRPTAHAESPAKPDPHPPLGGIGPDGQPIGGPRLLSRGLVLPAGAPRLPKQVTAHAWLIGDLDTGAILAARDPHGRYQPASILKALAALVLLPELPGSRMVTVDASAANVEGSAVGLVAGGKYSVDTLFEGLLLMSGNDAAMALAEAAGGTVKTAAAMNREILSLGGYDTFVEHPSGLDGWRQLTSAYDMALVLRAVANTPRFVAYDRTFMTYLPRQKVHGKKYRRVPLYNQSQNFLTGVKGAVLAKTGYTDAARHTYMCVARRGGHRLGIVFLRAERLPSDQYQQAAALLSWAGSLPPGSSVGRLDGPVVAAPPAPPPTSASARASSEPAAVLPASTSGHSRTSTGPLTALVGAAVLLGGALVLLRRRRTAH